MANNETPSCKKKENIHPFALTKTQWQLIHGELSTENPSSTRADIREDKLQKLPERFSNLFEDIVTFGEKGVFADGLGEKELDYNTLFFKILIAERASRRYSNLELTLLHDRKVIEKANALFGLEIGRMAYYLCRDTELARPREILNGFFIGMMVDSIEKDGIGVSAEQMTELEEHIEFLRDEIRTWSQLADYSIGKHYNIYQNLSVPRRLVEEVLKEFDIIPSVTVTSHVMNEINFSIPAVGNSEPAKKRDKNKVKEYVEEFIQNSDIVQLEELYSTVKSDLEELSDEEKDKQDGKRLIEQAVKEDNSFLRSDIDIENSNGAEYLLKKFSGIEEHLHRHIVDSTPWPDRPLLTKNGSRWEATPYAELLLRIDSLNSDEDTHPVDLFHRYVLDGNKLSTDDKQLIEAGLEVI